MRRKMRRKEKGASARSRPDLRPPGGNAQKLPMRARPPLGKKKRTRTNATERRRAMMPGSERRRRADTGSAERRTARPSSSRSRSNRGDDRGSGGHRSAGQARRQQRGRSDVSPRSARASSSSPPARRPPSAERKIDALMDTLRRSDSRNSAWPGAELRDEARGLEQARRRSPGRDDVARREAEFQATRRERAARDALAQTAAEEELQTERIRRHAAETRANSLAKELAEVRAQLVLAENRAQGTVPVPVVALTAEARGVAQMGEEIAALQAALASTQSECAAAMAAMTAECSLVYALVDEIRQRNDDATTSVALMTRAMTVYAGLETTAAAARDVNAKGPPGRRQQSRQQLR